MYDFMTNLEWIHILIYLCFLIRLTFGFTEGFFCCLSYQGYYFDKSLNTPSRGSESLRDRLSFGVGVALGQQQKPRSRFLFFLPVSSWHLKPFGIVNVLSEYPQITL